MQHIDAKGAVYITSRLIDNKWVIRILDENSCVVVVRSTVEPIMIGDARMPEHEPARPSRGLLKDLI